MSLLLTKAIKVDKKLFCHQKFEKNYVLQKLITKMHYRGPKNNTFFRNFLVLLFLAPTKKLFGSQKKVMNTIKSHERL